jgi:hypothetical protein
MLYDALRRKISRRDIASRLCRTTCIRRVLKPERRTVVSVWQDLDRHPVYEALFETTAQSRSKCL